MIENRIENQIVRVDWRKAMPRLKPKLNGLRSNWRRAYIGITSDPDSRWLKHRPKGWYKMVLLYEALTPDIAQMLEIDLIDYARRCNFLLDVENISPGGERQGSNAEFTYLYVLVGDKRNS